MYAAGRPENSPLRAVPPVDGSPVSLGVRLRQFRERAGLTQEALAERAGLGVATLASLERDQRRRPHLHTLVMLAEALRLLPEERLALTAAARQAPDAHVATIRPLAVAMPRSNLPAARTRLIGRAHELALLADILADPGSRLVTVTGMGGVGKTSLALAVARELRNTFADGVWLVELAPLAAPRLVPQAIADALGVTSAPETSLQDAVLAFLRARLLLLVLDNCEHLVDACADLAAQVLDTCPGVRLLATSREPLLVAGERQVRLAPLAVPGQDPHAAVEHVADSPAAQLFIERAQAADSAFVLTPRTAPAVGSICTRLAGIPLAIELAAARVRVLSPEQILVRLDNAFEVLVGGSRTAPTRQQTLRAVLDWSYALLGEPDRGLFRRLSVFAGGFDLEAAEAIQVGAGQPRATVLDVLSRLVDKSLVVTDSSGAATRYHLLQPVREYALARLAESGAAETTAALHRDWCLALVERVEPEWVDPAHVAQLEREQDNLRSALRWSIDRHDASVGLRLAVSGGQPLWYLRGHYAEGRAWLSELLSIGGSTDLPGLRAAGLVWAGQLAYCEGSTADAETLLEEGLALAESVGDGRAIGNAEQILGNLERGRGDLKAAKEHYSRARQVAQRQGRLSTESMVLMCLAMTCLEQGDSDGTRSFITQLDELMAVRDNPLARARMHVIRARLAALDGDNATAEALLEVGLALIREQGDQQGLIYARRLAAYSALDDSNWTDAARHLGEMLRVGRATHDRASLARALDAVGETLAGRGQFKNALRLAATASALRDALGVRPPPIETIRLERWIDLARGRLGDEFRAAWLEGQRQPLDQAVDIALHLVEATASVEPAPSHIR